MKLPVKRVFYNALVWLLVLSIATLSAELYLRHSRKYQLWTFPLTKIKFHARSPLKIYNSSFYETHAAEFKYWPVPVETFKSDIPTPHYYYKPNLRMVKDGYGFRPAKAHEKVYFRTNSIGLRGADVKAEKPDKLIRIVCLGASTTEGGKSPEDETYPAMLEEILRDYFKNRPVEVINAGHHSYKADEIYVLLKDKILPLKPDLLIYYQAQTNIIAKDFLASPHGCETGYLGADCWLRAYPAYYRLLYGNSALFKHLAYKFGWFSSSVTYIPHQIKRAEDVPSLSYYKESVEQIVKLAQLNDIQIVLTSFATIAHDSFKPERDENRSLYESLYQTWYPFLAGEIEALFNRFNEASRSIAEEYNTGYADVAALMPKDKEYFSYDIIHFSKSGSRKLAEIISQAIIKDGML